MALTINTNVQSLNAQRQLNDSQNMLARSMERLSSGLRINSAKDDAAGLAISDRMNAQIRGLNQAVRNANDGISLAQTAEGATQEIVNILQSMREISVQAANETYSKSDRASMQDEINQLYNEINRIAETTEFNGIKLLDGSGGSRNFQVGANSNQVIALSLQSVKSQDLNLNGYSALGELNGGRVSGVTSSANQVLINDVAISSSGGTAISAAAAINEKSGETGVTATAYNTYQGVGGQSGITDGTLAINGDTIAASGNMQELVANINRDAAGVTATLESDGSILLTNDTGDNIVIANNGNTGTGLVDGTYQGYISLTSADNSEIEISLAETSENDRANLAAFGFNESTGSGTIVGQSVNSASVIAGDLEINGVDIGSLNGSSAGDKAAGINAVSDQTGVTASAETKWATNVNMNSAAAVAINGTEVDLSTTATLTSAVTLINTSVQGVVASADSDGNLVLTSQSGLDIQVSATAAFFTDHSGGVDTYRGQITLSSDNGSDITISGKDAASLAKFGFNEQGGSDHVIGTGLSVETTRNANIAIERIDDAINQVDAFRGEMGAVQNRLESTIANLSNISENLSGARSRILDADIAMETSAMIKANILQQAGVSILAQANQQPQIALSLLQ